MMKTSMTSYSETNTGQGLLRWAAQMLASLVIAWLVLFVSAGRLNWTAGWVFFIMNTLTQILSSCLLISRQPGMLADRATAQAGTKSWDKFFAPAIAIFGSLAMFVTAGLDARFGWSGPVVPAVWLLALIISFGSQIFVLWAMASNPFFATTVRIQEERGHTVIKQGPYELVRHPGYLGSVVYTLFSPLVLNSFWAFIPAILTVILLIVRTGLEDRTLKAELPGYSEYATKTRYRLFPGIW
jgi:protein-S-isoprenylcysteine O-methyltransferase Ste14